VLLDASARCFHSQRLTIAELILEQVRKPDPGTWMAIAGRSVGKLLSRRHTENLPLKRSVSPEVNLHRPKLP
jgi:hypothetical protein